MDLFETLSYLFMFLCSLLGLICAIVFIGIVCFYRQCRTLTNMLIFSSVLAGVMINTTGICQAIYQLTSDGNDALCAFRGFLLHGSTGFLYHTLCVQALHRLFVIVFATRRYLQSARVMVPIVIVQWIVSNTFGLPALIAGRITYQPGSRICQASLNDLVIFLYLAVFIYFGPILIIISIYLRIAHYMKQNSFATNIVQMVAKQRRQQREFRLIRRILIPVVLLVIMGIPYLVFFLIAQFSQSKPAPYAQRVSYLSISFSYCACMLFNLITTDDVKKCLIDWIRHARPGARNARVQCATTINLRMQTVVAPTL